MPSTRGQFVRITHHEQVNSLNSHPPKTDWCASRREADTRLPLRGPSPLSSRDANLDDRKVGVAFEKLDFDLQRRASTRNRYARSRARSGIRISGARFQPTRFVRRDDTVPDLSRGRPTEALMRSGSVVPNEVPGQRSSHGGSRKRHEHATEAFVLHASNEAFDQRDAPVFADRAKARLDVAATTPVDIGFPKLDAAVRDHVLGTVADALHSAFEHLGHLLGRWFLTEDREADGSTGEVVDHHGDPPTEGPADGQREGKPGNTEPRAGGHQRKVHIPNMVRVLGRDRPSGSRCGDGWFGCRRRSIEHSTDGGCAEMKPSASEHVREARLSHVWAQNSELLDREGDELRKAIDGHRRAHEARVIAAPKPACDRRRSHHHPFCGSAGRPTARHHELQDRESFNARAGTGVPSCSSTCVDFVQLAGLRPLRFSPPRRLRQRSAPSRRERSIDPRWGCPRRIRFVCAGRPKPSCLARSG
jgi:hypothetical protein